ncbi:MAG: MFS transporter [Elusimicrobia bacterium]|nr:MFS transporter [Elusimicrobiota bacterium]
MTESANAISILAAGEHVVPPFGGKKPRRFLKFTKVPYFNVALLVGCGIFASTYAQTGVIGLYPFRFLLKDKLHEGPLRVALFMQLAAMPWNLKIISGIISDSIPIFGTRRRHYLIFSSLAAGLLWLAVAVVPPRYTPMVIMAVIMNIALVFVSTISGGILVEGGQTFGVTGKLSSVRVLAMNIAGLGVPLGALLATRALGVSAMTAAIPLFLLFFIALFLYKEKPTAKRDPKIWKGIVSQLKIALKAKTLWAASGLLFLVQFAPGFLTPLMFYQTDTLHFSEKFIGLLTLIDAIAGAAGAFFYVYFCRRLSLRQLLYGSVFFTAALSLLYLGYNDKNSAMMIEAIYCFALSLAQLPLFDLAARATPKGSEAVGYSVIMSVWNWGLFFSDLIGSALFEKYHMTFKNLVWVNAGTTILVLAAIPFLPALLVDHKEVEGQSAAAA